MDFLETWKESEHRKPLILQGARQVGKTYSILEFGRTHYENVAYFNFETDPKLNETFEENISPDYLIPILSHIAGQTIVKEKTLIVFDEVQLCERALTSLKYFNESAPDYHIIVAGSLLGVAVNREKFSFPVGKVDMRTLYPMDMEERQRSADAGGTPRCGYAASPAVSCGRRDAGVCDAVCPDKGLYPDPPYTGYHSCKLSQRHE